MPPLDRPEPPAAEELDSLWDDLKGDDDARAWRAVWRMSRWPSEVLALIRRRLQPAPAAPDEVTRPLLAGLNRDSFKRREKEIKYLRE